VDLLPRYALSSGVNIACSLMSRHRRRNSRINLCCWRVAPKYKTSYYFTLNSTPLFTNVSSSLSSCRGRVSLKRFPSDSFVGRHSPLFHWELVNYSFVSRISKATDCDQIAVDSLCHAGRRLLISEQDCEKGVQPTSVRIAGLKVLGGFREAIGCGCVKPTIESGEEDQFLSRYKN